MLPKLEKAKQIRASMALEAQNIAPETSLVEESPLGGQKLNEDYGDTVPSKPQDAVSSETVLVQRTVKGDFDTVVVKDGTEIDKTAVHASAPTAKDSSPAPGHLRSLSIRRVGDKQVESRMGETGKVDFPFGGSMAVAQPMQVSSPSSFDSPEPKLEADSAAQTAISAGMSGGSLTNETVSRKALDKLWSIYSAGNTVPIPFLRATDISPIALLSDNVLGGRQGDSGGSVAVEAIQELFTSDAQTKKGRSRQNEVPLPPSVYQRLTSSPTLMNLAQALAYHKMCYEEMPLQEMQATQEQQTIQNLSDTLRTILRL